MGECGAAAMDSGNVVRWWHGGAAQFMYVVVGAGYGFVVTVGLAHRGGQPWLVWASLAVGLTSTSGFVFGYALRLAVPLTGPGGVARRKVAGYVGRVAALGVAMLMVGAVLSVAAGRNPAGRHDGDLIGTLLVVFAGLGAIPVIAGLGAVRERAITLAGAPGERIELIITLRQLLAALLAALGALVALATVALGAALQVTQRSQPTEVVVFGAALSVIVAVSYAPAAGALTGSARQVCREITPLGGLTAADLPARLDERRRMETALGVDRGLLADLQSGIIIVAPLLASAAAAFLPG